MIINDEIRSFNFFCQVFKEIIDRTNQGGFGKVRHHRFLQ